MRMQLTVPCVVLLALLLATQAREAIDPALGETLHCSWPCRLSCIAGSMIADLSAFGIPADWIGVFRYRRPARQSACYKALL